MLAEMGAHRRNVARGHLYRPSKYQREVIFLISLERNVARRHHHAENRAAPKHIRDDALHKSNSNVSILSALRNKGIDGVGGLR